MHQAACPCAPSPAQMVSSVANMLLAVADKGVRVDSAWAFFALFASLRQPSHQAVSYLSKMVNLPAAQRPFQFVQVALGMAWQVG